MPRTIKSGYQVANKGVREARQPSAGDPGPVPAADHQGNGARERRNLVGYVPNVDQTFGGYSAEQAGTAGRNFPACVKRKLPWQGKIKVVKNGVITNQNIK